MCCFLAALLAFGPRLAFVVYWLFPAGRLKMAFAFDTWIWPLLGWIFLPWTTLLFVILFPVIGFDWVIVGIGFLADLAGWAGSARSRQQVPGYRGP